MQFVTIGGLVTHFVDHYQPVRAASAQPGFFLPVRQIFLLNHSHAAIHMQGLPGDISRLITGEVECG